LPDGRIAAKSFAINYELQAAGCYITTFLANANGNIAHLSLLMGTVLNVDSISFQKLTSGGFTTIYTFPVSQLQYDLDFSPLVQGINVFRAKIVLANGAVIYSNQENVAYADPGKYLVYPVPAFRNSGITIFTPAPAGEIFTIIDASGRVLLRKELRAPYENIKTNSLQRGIYFFRINKTGIKSTSGKLILL
jgi:hypothetical protein